MVRSLPDRTFQLSRVRVAGLAGAGAGLRRARGAGGPADRLTWAENNF